MSACAKNQKVPNQFNDQALYVMFE